MTSTITLEQAQAHLRELVANLTLGEELVITDNHQPVAKLVGQQARPVRPAPGLGKGGIIYMAADFDDSIEDFLGEPG